MMSDSRDPTATETDAEIRRVCCILESIAQQYPEGSPESVAIADAAAAYILVHQRQSLAKAYQQLKAACKGVLPAEVHAKLRGRGTDPSDLDADF